jgi:hypothetical protein
MPSQTTDSPQTAAAASLPSRAQACLNSLTHGGASQTLFIPGENPDDFYALLENIFAEFQPATTHSAGIASDAAVARWFLWRRQRAFLENESQLFTEKPNQADWTEADLHRLNLFDRYKTQAERAFRRAFVNLEAVRKETARELHWQANLELAKQRFALQNERFQLAKEKHASAHPPKEPSFSEVLKKATRHMVRQYIWITTTTKGTEIDVIQPNAAIRQEIAKRQAESDPFEIVSRTFVIEGPLPTQFAWIAEDLEPNLDDDGTASYHYRMYLETFARLSADEDARPDIPFLCHFPYE